MATEAQMLANRGNAARSTGPRTRQGKEIVAQNALRHGLLSRQNVVAGEDQQEFDAHRQAVLGELRPAGTIETLLAERIAGLAWRLMRAERIENQAFDYLLAKELHNSTYAFPDSLTAKEEKEMCDSHKSDPGLAVGRTLVKDCANDKVLDRLTLCEQRIEGSLRRTMKDLRSLRTERQAESPDGGPVRSVPVRACPELAEGAYPPVSQASCPRSEGGTPSTRTPGGVTTNGADSAKQSQSDATHWQPMSDRAEQSQSPAGGGHSPPYGTDSAEQSQSQGTEGQRRSGAEAHREPETAWPGCAEQSQLPADMEQAAGDGSRETKPIEGGAVCSVPVRAYPEPVEGACRSTGILPVSSMGVPPMCVVGIPSASSGQALPAIRGRDALDTNA